MMRLQTTMVKVDIKIKFDERMSRLISNESFNRISFHKHNITKYNYLRIHDPKEK